ncbi:Thioredoxin [Halogranum amylolyticum]|uniref:Thioredoxin n=1 Tax=Halogranum amylolyticum TaxID=660520 RepID=A0A1H8S4Z3_9EURY|nr:thioredoxin domain-containing protein [Halogranum amylolyticum]SEO73761.1 Thioredoxin [Halogranum amylolyticum]
MRRRPTRRSFAATTTVALTGLAGCTSRFGTGDETATSVPVHWETTTSAHGIELDCTPVVGSLDAPLVLYYWTDYCCPFCEQFERETLPKLLENEVDSGELRIVSLQFPNVGDNSMLAAATDKCVWRQVRESTPETYLDWHAAVFDAQGEPNSGWADRDDLLDVARGVDGLPVDDVESCLRTQGEAVRERVGTEVERATERRLRGTPGFVLHHPEKGVAGKLAGAQPYSRFEEAMRRIRSV